MDVLIVIIAALLLITGIAGSVLPVLPGLPVSWLGLVLLKFTENFSDNISWEKIIWAGVLTLIVSLIDSFLPVMATRKYGGGKLVTIGASLGLVLGFMMGFVGVFIGPFIGAFVGGMLEGQKFNLSFRQALATFAGFFAGIVLKLVCGGILAIIFVTALF